MRFTIVNSRWRRVTVPGLLGLALIVSPCAVAFAQNAPPLFLQGGLLTSQPSATYKPLNIGGWLFSPSLLVGGIYDSNVFQSSQQQVSAGGLRVAPTLTANLNTGLLDTTIYGDMDAVFYSGEAAGENLINGHAGIRAVYRPLEDLVFNFRGEYSHQTNLFSNVVSNPSPNSELLISPIDTSSTNQSNVFTALASVEKTLEQGFLGIGASVVYTSYEDLNSQDGTVYTVSGRAGYYLVPNLYAFVQPSVDWSNYADSSLNSNGYRVVGGIGSDQIGLFRGEIYGGYQGQRYTGQRRNTSRPVLGGRVSYLPTPYWTITASVDQTFDVGVPPNSTSPSSQSSRTETTSAILRSEYALSQIWTASGSVGWVEIRYLDRAQTDDNWLFDAKLRYSVWSNLALTFAYQYTATTSNAPNAGYNRHLVTAGLFYKY